MGLTRFLRNSLRVIMGWVIIRLLNGVSSTVQCWRKGQRTNVFVTYDRSKVSIQSKPQQFNKPQAKRLKSNNSLAFAKNSTLIASHDDNSFDYRYQVWRNAVYEALIDADMDDEAQRWLDCETLHRVKLKSVGLPPELPEKTQYIMVCSHDAAAHPKIIQKHTCGLRYCPTCAEQHSARLVARYAPVIESLCEKLTKHSRYQFRHIVFTTPYSLHDDDIDEKYKHHRRAMLKVFDALLPDGWRKKQALLIGDEFGEHGDKLHSHVLHYGQYLVHDKLVAKYKEVTGEECQIVYVKGIKPDSESVVAKVQEVLKYCTKFWREDDDGNRKMIDPDVIPKLAAVLKGQRRIRTYGLFYNIPEPERHDKECLCEVCNAPMTKVWRSDYEVFRQTGMTWQEIADSLNETLNLKTANKSLLMSGLNNKSSPPKQQKLPLSGIESNALRL